MFSLRFESIIEIITVNRFCNIINMTQYANIFITSLHPDNHDATLFNHNLIYDYAILETANNSIPRVTLAIKCTSRIPALEKVGFKFNVMQYFDCFMYKDRHKISTPNLF